VKDIAQYLKLLFQSIAHDSDILHETRFRAVGID
jgi:hypothetical protein